MECRRELCTLYFQIVFFFPLLASSFWTCTTLRTAGYLIFRILATVSDDLFVVIFQKDLATLRTLN